MTLYGKRFTIEETFRGTKDIHFGMGLKATHIGDSRKHFLLLLLALAGAALACSREGRSATMTPEAIVAQLEMPLPVGTRIIGASASNDRDGLIRAKLEMPAAQLPSFISSANIPGLEEAEPDLLGPDEGFWDPHRAGPLQSGQAAKAGARYLLVAVDQSRPNAAIVYVMLIGT